MNALADFRLHVDEAILDAGVTVGFVLLSGIVNRMSEPSFYPDRDERLRAVLDTQPLAALRTDPVLRGYRELHAHFDISDPAIVPSPESLFEVLFRHGELRRINPLVDIYNTVALRRRLSCGAHALGQLDGAIRLAITDGSETFIPLGAQKPVVVPAGEYAYVDGANRIICRRECRQAAHSAVSGDTGDVAIIVQGNRAVAADAIELACREIVEHIGRYLEDSGEAYQRIVGPATRVRTTTGALA